MKVFKFGGGSVKNADGIILLAYILSLYKNENLIVVISAIGKTTNLLESVVSAWENNQPKLDDLVNQLIDNHIEIIKNLKSNTAKLIDAIAPLFDQLKANLQECPSDNYSLNYDSVVSYGELISTTLISEYLNISGLSNIWADARKLIKTDSCHCEGRVNWAATSPCIKNYVEQLSQQTPIRVITQGFIGSAGDSSTTTLGREGSDYTAAIFGFCLDADSVTIWKDVDGVYNADPKKFDDVVKLEEISYEEAIELSYYGASIIHPKTIKPLQNKGIPLFVNSFFYPEKKGTTISSVIKNKSTVPAYIIKDNQILISIFPKDFSFIAVNNLSDIFTLLTNLRISINLMQNSALSFSICIDNNESKVENLILNLKKNYNIKYNKDVILTTIRHYNTNNISKITNDKEILIEQINRTTIQLVMSKK